MACSASTRASASPNIRDGTSATIAIGESNHPSRYMPPGYNDPMVGGPSTWKYAAGCTSPCTDDSTHSVGRAGLSDLLEQRAVDNCQ
jgi:hypothetical protein